MTHPLPTRRALLLGGLLMSLGFNAFGASGNWPERPIRLVVAGSSGAGGDIFARLIAAPLSKALNQPVVVEAKPGANGMIACDTVAKAAEAGVTVIVVEAGKTLLLERETMVAAAERHGISIVGLRHG